MSEKGMQILHSKKLLHVLKQVSLEFCEIFVYRKKERVIFLRVGNENKSEQLELVHTCVWGLDEVQSISESRYYVSFTDDATRKNMDLLHQTRVFSTFKNQKHLVENETRKNLKCLIFYNGGQQCNKELDSYYLYNASHREKIIPRAPQENSVSERMNRTITEFAKVYEIACMVSVIVLASCCRY